MAGYLHGVLEGLMSKLDLAHSECLATFKESQKSSEGAHKCLGPRAISAGQPWPWDVCPLHLLLELFFLRTVPGETCQHLTNIPCPAGGDHVHLSVPSTQACLPFLPTPFFPTHWVKKVSKTY